MNNNKIKQNKKCKSQNHTKNKIRKTYNKKDQ